MWQLSNLQLSLTVQYSYWKYHMATLAISVLFSVLLRIFSRSIAAAPIPFFRLKWSTYLFRFRTPSKSIITFFYLKVKTSYLRKFKLLSERKNRVYMGTIHVNMIMGCMKRNISSFTTAASITIYQGTRFDPPTQFYLTLPYLRKWTSIRTKVLK